MAIETHQDLTQPAGSGPEVGGPGGVMRPWWLRPGAHVGVVGAEVRRGGRETGLSRYFRYTLDHKVVGIQYLYGMIAYFLTGGLFAMVIRSELLSPSSHLIWPNQYLMAGCE